jgi:glycosyltransferase involved in cell wall biosynthesis
VTNRLVAVHQGGGFGGAPVSLLKLLSALDPAEFAAHAILTEPGPMLDYARSLGISAQVVPAGGAFFYSAHARLGPRVLARFIRTFPGAVRSARSAIRRLHPDLVHLNSSVLLAWAAAARHERVPSVWVVREVLGPNPWLRRWHARFIVRHSRSVVAISDAVGACFPGSVDRVYNAVDLSEFDLRNLDLSAAVRTELGVPADAKVLVVIGSVQHPKGHWLLLDAFARLPSSTHLMLVTGGVPSEYAATLRGRVKTRLGLPLDNLDLLMRDASRLGVADRIHVTGFRTDVARMLSAADVLVFPSLEPEGFGRPIIEAMALARPVVATDVGPSAELLGDDGAGRLVAPEVAAVARAISELLGSPEARLRMGREGRARVERCFTLDRQVVQMSMIYRKALLSA